MPGNVSLAYSALNNGEPFNVPLPTYSLSAAFGSAGGAMSCATDLLKYYRKLMNSWSARASSRSTSNQDLAETHAFDESRWSFAPLQIMEIPTLREKSYAAGWARSQLPGTFGDLGTNLKLVDEMPLLADGVQSQLAVWHQGSLVGATPFVMLLPETESAVLVLTNTMAINDAADWIGQTLVGTLLESPSRNDYVALASASVDRAFKKYTELTLSVGKERECDGPQRSLSDYVGSYVGIGGLYQINVVENEGNLDVVFQGRKSQKYPMRHHHKDTFTWFMTWNEQIKRARFLSFQPSLYFIHFGSISGKQVDTLTWMPDPSIAEIETFTRV